MSLLTDNKPSQRRRVPKRSGHLSFIPGTKLTAPHILYTVGFIHEQDCPALGLSTLDLAFVLAAPVTFKPASLAWSTRIFVFCYLYHSSGQWWPWSPWKWCVQHILLDQRRERNRSQSNGGYGNENLHTSGAGGCGDHWNSYGLKKHHIKIW